MITISKLIIAVFEGLNHTLLKEWMGMGEMPNFGKVDLEGHIKELDCTRIPYEASGLVTAFSGMSEKEHGVISYWQTQNELYIPVLWESKQIKDKMFWNKCDNRFAIINVFGTHPVYEVNGYIISYAMKQHSLRYSYPPDLIHELSKNGVNYVQDLTVFYSKQSKEEFCGGVKRIEEIRLNTVNEILKLDVDVFVANFTCIDRVSHFYTKELQENSPLESKAVFQAYKSCDSILGELIGYAQKTNSEILFFSEIGFGPLNAFVQINDYLIKKGFLEWDSTINRPDWKKTIAFESVQGSHGININKKSFYKEGIVKEEEYESTLSEVINHLKEMPNPHNENPMFSNVFASKDYFNNNAIVPDIILEPYDWQYLPYGDNYWADIVSRHSQTGWHRNKSVWGGLGPKASSSIRDGDYNLIDILPSIYSLIGNNKSDALPGKSFFI